MTFIRIVLNICLVLSVLSGVLSLKVPEEARELIMELRKEMYKDGREFYPHLLKESWQRRVVLRQNPEMILAYPRILDLYPEAIEHYPRLVLKRPGYRGKLPHLAKEYQRWQDLASGIVERGFGFTKQASDGSKGGLQCQEPTYKWNNCMESRNVTTLCQRITNKDLRLNHLELCQVDTENDVDDEPMTEVTRHGDELLGHAHVRGTGSEGYGIGDKGSKDSGDKEAAGSRDEKGQGGSEDNGNIKLCHKDAAGDGDKIPTICGNNRAEETGDKDKDEQTGSQGSEDREAASDRLVRKQTETQGNTAGEVEAEEMGDKDKTKLAGKGSKAVEAGGEDKNKQAESEDSKAEVTDDRDEYIQAESEDSEAEVTDDRDEYNQAESEYSQEEIDDKDKYQWEKVYSEGDTVSEETDSEAESDGEDKYKQAEGEYTDTEVTDDKEEFVETESEDSEDEYDQTESEDSEDESTQIESEYSKEEETDDEDKISQTESEDSEAEETDDKDENIQEGSEDSEAGETSDKDENKQARSDDSERQEKDNSDRSYKEDKPRVIRTIDEYLAIVEAREAKNTGLLYSIRRFLFS